MDDRLLDCRSGWVVAWRLADPGQMIPWYIVLNELGDFLRIRFDWTRHTYLIDHMQCWLPAPKGEQLMRHVLNVRKLRWQFLFAVCPWKTRLCVKSGLFSIHVHASRRDVNVTWLLPFIAFATRTGDDCRVHCNNRCSMDKTYKSIKTLVPTKPF